MAEYTSPLPYTYAQTRQGGLLLETCYNSSSKSEAMIAVQSKEAYADALSPLESSVDEAVRRMAIERANERIAELHRKIAGWQERYQCSYELFAYRTAMDEEYVADLNNQPETQQWEADLAAWEFYATELAEWQKRLQNILTA